ncbi:Peritrophin-1 [Pseudolycoriella hygida]|uniref:Peritrophin-1 n=1 Tax=Pseudolycoriella hygida TaxID=35572 RepID=A0A9Q0N9F0_9DIPT|nr:Peritrophin-1 [Pseudolycoriella hygida]
MEKSLIIAVVLATVFAIGIHASAKLTQNDFGRCECNNNICENVENNTALPNEAGCEHFFICIDGRPVPNTCPQGQWFNPDVSQCDNSTSPCDEKDEFQCPPDGIHFFPHDEYCNKFIMCFAGFPIIMQCADGLYFDRELGQCNFPEYAECDLEICPPENDPGDIIFLPSEQYCDKFFICFAGRPIKFFCPEGLHFNREINTCDFIENANCTIEGKPEPPGPPLPHEVDCDCADSIFFVPHPNSCEHYFICARGQSHMIDCAPGFYFDSKNNWCDHPENVECGASNSTTTTGPPGDDVAPPPVTPFFTNLQ